MNGDFGTELDAALNQHLSALHQAADDARIRIAQGVETLTAAVPAPPARPPVDQPSPMFFDGPPFEDEMAGEALDDIPARSGAPVSFDIDEPAVDSEGIPFPEENF